MKRVECVYQNLPNECGACCVSMIMKYYGINISLNQLRLELGVGKNGVLMSSMKKVLDSYGFDTKIYQCNAKGAVTFNSPSIIGWGQNHFVILSKKRKNLLEIYDPAVGKIDVTMEEFDEKFNGFLLHTENKIKKRKRNYNLKREIPSKTILYVVLLEFFTFLFSLGQPYFVQNIIDSIDVNNLIGIYIVLSIMALLIISGICEYLKINISNKAYIKFTKKIIDGTINLPYKSIQLYTSGDIIFRLNCMSIYNQVYFQNIPSIVCEVILVFVSFLGIVAFSKDIAIILGLILMFTLILIWIAVDKMIVLTNKSIKAERDQSSFIDEAINAIREIRVNGMESETFNNWYVKFNFSNSIQVSIAKIQNIYKLFTEMVYIVCPLIVLIIGLYIDKMELGKIMACYSFSTILFRSISSISVNIYSLKNGKKYLASVEELLEVFNNNQGRLIKKDQLLNSTPFNINVRNMNFRYAKYDTEILSKININVPAGSFVAIVGKSGSGKSTLLKLLIGMYNDYSGSIKINDKELSDIDKKNYFENIGVVSQDFIIFNKSIYDNITMGRDAISFEDVCNICGILYLDEEIKVLPMGYNTIVQGDNFSGGQRQRMAIARALVGKPKILFWDEATNFLDSKIENSILNYVKKLDCTKIIVTHHMNIIKDADIIFLLDNGIVIKEGKYKDIYSEA